VELDITSRGNGSRIAISQQFTFADNHKFKQIMDLTKQENLQFLELDFAKVDFIDSAGLGMLLLLRDECQNRHIPISIHSAHGQVEKIFMISKFDQLFSIQTGS
jgi:anti-anti-sigma factor